MNNIRFLLGDYAEKRKYLRASQLCSYADNDEVEGVIRISGKDYFFLSGHPFGDFTALQYLSYMRALINFAPMTERDMKNITSALGVRLPPNKKLKNFSVLGRRLISLVANFKPGCELRINLDGYGYTRRRARKLKHMLKRISRIAIATVSVSDNRFVFKGATVQQIKSGYVYSSAARVRTRFISRCRITKLLKTTCKGMPVPAAKVIVEAA